MKKVNTARPNLKNVKFGMRMRKNGAINASH